MGPWPVYTRKGGGKDQRDQRDYQHPFRPLGPFRPSLFSSHGPGTHATITRAGDPCYYHTGRGLMLLVHGPGTQGCKGVVKRRFSRLLQESQKSNSQMHGCVLREKAVFIVFLTLTALGRGPMLRGGPCYGAVIGAGASGVCSLTCIRFFVLRSMLPRASAALISLLAVSSLRTQVKHSIAR
ncbi:hypothetical protein UC8_04590 [Roseimaritima ulvae]|uniref:Uncharacterized protein n=1 Tax=Roseimaritima ulvae TaxID=980254 RepID=A0A5B9QL52_9BACT|nr:hypothetical protein UC8_04590 [Roseimaritima ulvae]